MRLIDKQYLCTPFFGSRQMTHWLQRQGHRVNRKRIQRLMRLMALQAIAPGPHTSRPHPEHPICPYRLRGLAIEHSCQVWCADITYIPMRRGFMVLMAVLDWFSRYVVSWRLSNTLDTVFCVEALDAALETGQPLIFNTDQGAQFTSTEWIERLKAWDILISMDGRGRALDNVFVERLWRTLKYEDIYLRGYDSPTALERGLGSYISFYNKERPHTALDQRTPAEVHWAHMPET